MGERVYPEAADDTPENREHQAEKLIEFLNRSGIAERVNSSLDDKSRFVENLSTKEAQDILERLNGIILGIPIGQRSIHEFSGFVQDPRIEKIIWIPPSSDAQEHILRDVVLPEIKNLKPEDVPEVLAAEINLLHMFQDGNGRLARIVYLLTKPGFKVDSSEESASMMKRYLAGGEGVLNFDPSFLEQDFRNIIFSFSHATDMRAYQVLNVANIPGGPLDRELVKEPDYVPKSPKEALLAQTRVRYGIEPFDVLIALREALFIKRKNAREFLVPNREEGGYSIDCGKFFDSIKPEEVEFVASAFDYPKEMRARIIIDTYKILINLGVNSTGLI